MARFDVYANPGGAGYLLDVQADLLDGLNTRIVVPLMAANDAPTPTRRLNPTFKINDNDYVMVTQFLAAVPLAILKQPVTTLAEHDTEITAALDMAFFGF